MEFLQNAYDKGVRKDSEIQAAKVYENTHSVLQNGSNTVGLLWKNSSRPRDNKKQALSQFFPSERRMKEDGGQKWEEFNKNVQEWLEKGYCIKLPPNDNSKGFVIPTFIVVRLDKNTTKFRLIINGAYQYENKCINDYLLSGQSLMNNIHEIL